MSTVRVFTYIEQLDAFVVTDEYRDLADRLGLTEWHPVVWVGRLFTLDNDYGEHWFDNWDEREAVADAARQLGMASDELLIIVPDRLKNDVDGPCHPAEFRKQFWTDVLKSLTLSYDALFEKARLSNVRKQTMSPEDSIADLEERIAAIRASIRATAGRRAPQPEPRQPPPYTPRQGQYLAFIHTYSVLHGYPPAEMDIQRYFKVSPPTVHQMILTLEKRGLIARRPGQARSIRVLVPPADLPALGETTPLLGNR